MQRSSNKQCKLNKKGLEKLNNALKKIFSCDHGDITYIDIEVKTTVNRELVSKIMACREAVTKSSLEKLFDPIHRILVEKYQENYHLKLNIETMVLNDEDYDKITILTPASKPSTLHKTKNNPQLVDLQKALSKLNYISQFEPFTNWVNKHHQIGAFLIQGEKNRGQRWLVNCLVQQKLGEYYETEKVIAILPPDSTKTKKEEKIYIDKVWEELGTKLGLKSEKTAENCVRKAREILKNSSLFITFYVDNFYTDIHKNIDKDIYKSIHQLIDEFWKPLEKEANYLIEEEEVRSYLLMFLIDSTGTDCSSQWGIETIDPTNQTNWHPQKLIALPKINNFEGTPDGILFRWCRINGNLLRCSNSSVRDIVQKIWNNSQGVPEDTFNEIVKIVFDSDDFSWSKFEQQLQYKL